jgi:branched-chain amino acid transport system substrate-binding protein
LFDAVNARGGINGAAIELVTLDDAAQPAKTVEHTRTLLEDPGLVALFGYAFVPGLVQALPLADAKRVPLIGVYNGADNLRGQPGLFTTTASLRDEVASMVQNLATLNTRRIVVAYQNNELGRYMLPQVQAVADASRSRSPAPCRCSRMAPTPRRPGPRSRARSRRPSCCWPPAPR